MMDIFSTELIVNATIDLKPRNYEINDRIFTGTGTIPLFLQYGFFFVQYTKM